MKNALIHLLGGYSKDDVLREAFKEIYLPLNPEDVLHVKEGDWLFMGKPLRLEQVEQIKLEAKQLNEMKLWGIIKLDVRYHLQRKMFEEVRIKEDLVWGQLASFLWDIVKTRVNQLASLK